MSPITVISSEPLSYSTPATAERLRDLVEREASLLATVIEYLPVGFYMGDFSGISVCNRVGLALLGFDAFAELQQNIPTLAEQIQTRSPETGVRLRPEEEPFARALLGEACTREVAYTHLKTGEEIVVECAAIPIRENGKVVAALAVNTDVTARKRTETALRKSRAELEQQAKHFDTVLSSIVDFAYTFNREGRFTYINQALLNLWQRSLKDAIGKNFFELDYPEALAARLQQQIETVFRTGRMLKDETPYTGAAGTTGYYEYIFAPVFGADGQVEAIAGSTRDITERKEMEKALLASEERVRNILSHIEALNVRLKRSMKETHHRVKNNLQVISAMIEMQVMEHQGEQTVPLDEFVRLKAHVHTLSIVHDLLTLNIKEEENAQRISTRVVLEKLLPMLQRTAWKQTVRYTLDEVELTTKQCIGLSLVLNELVSNALKHGKQQAEVTFTVEGGNAILTVCDDGEGFPEGFDPDKAANTGLELVDSLVRTDLRGTVAYGNQLRGGGQVIVTFPLPKDEE